MPDPQPEAAGPDSAIIRNLRKIALQHSDIATIEALTVRGTRLRFPEANQAAPSFVPEHPVNGTFTKCYTGHADLIDVLESRGLEVPDRPRAIDWLRKAGYYRLPPVTKQSIDRC